LESHPSDGFRVVTHSIVPDDSKAVHDSVKAMVDELHVSLCITTGGTGFGVRDGTREVRRLEMLQKKERKTRLKRNSILFLSAS